MVPGRKEWKDQEEAGKEATLVFLYPVLISVKGKCKCQEQAECNNAGLSFKYAFKV